MEYPLDVTESKHKNNVPHGKAFVLTGNFEILFDLVIVYYFEPFSSLTSLVQILILFRNIAYLECGQYDSTLKRRGGGGGVIHLQVRFSFCAEKAISWKLELCDF